MELIFPSMWINGRRWRKSLGFAQILRDPKKMGAQVFIASALLFSPWSAGAGLSRASLPQTPLEGCSGRLHNTCGKPAQVSRLRAWAGEESLKKPSWLAYSGLTERLPQGWGRGKVSLRQR